MWRQLFTEQLDDEQLSFFLVFQTFIISYLSIDYINEQYGKTLLDKS